MDGTALFASLGKMALYGLGIFAVLHIYFAICLTVLAKKTSTSGAALAWIPIANAFFLFRIGRRSGALGLLFFIPILNLAAAGIAWMSIAEARGKSPWIGILVLFPVLGWLLVPWILAIGPTTNPDSMWQPGMPSACTNCRAPLTQGDAFCGECGGPVSAVVARPRMSAGAMGVASFPVAAAFLLLAYFGESKAINGMFAYQPPARTSPAIPSEMTGTLSYFPIDGRPGNPSKPNGLTLQSLNENSGTTSKNASKVALPPGVSSSELPRVASAISTSTYKGGAAPVTVNVAKLRTSGAEAGPAIAQQITQATNGTRQGVNITPPERGPLTGERIDGAGKTIFVLWPADGGDDVVIMIHTTTDGAKDAEALAQGIGSKPPDTAEGVIGAAAPGAAVGYMPSEPPDDLQLVDFQSKTIDEFLAGSPDAPNSEASIAFIRQSFGWALPERASNAIYQNVDGKTWQTAVWDYGRMDRAWLMEKVFASAAGEGSKEIQISGFSGIETKVDKHWMIIARKGPYLIYCESPDDVDSGPMEKLLGGLQL